MMALQQHLSIETDRLDRVTRLLDQIYCTLPYRVGAAPGSVDPCSAIRVDILSLRGKVTGVRAELEAALDRLEAEAVATLLASSVRPETRPDTPQSVLTMRACS